MDLHRRAFLSTVAAAGVAGTALADEQTGGDPSTWTAGEQYGVATAYDHDVPMGDQPKLWYTLTEGALTEIRFPRVDVMNTGALEFVVVDPGSGYAARTQNVDPTVNDGVDRSVTTTEDDALVFEQTASAADDREWTLTVEYVADSEADAVVGDLSFSAATTYDLYLVCDPAVSNSAYSDSAARTDHRGGYGLTVADGTDNDGAAWFRDGDGEAFNVALGLTAERGFEWASADVVGGDLLSVFDGETPPAHDAAESNVLLAGRLASGTRGHEDTIAVGAAREQDTERALSAASAALDRGYGTVRADYVAGWERYVDAIAVPDSVAGDDRLRAHYNTSAMVLKAVEDKTFLGAGLAAPCVPWGRAARNDGPADYGYNHVWARDLYQVFTAFEAMGDVESARNALEYIFEYQQSADGFVPQNTNVQGDTRWGGEQLDQIAYPAVMAHTLWERHGMAPGDDAVAYDYDDVAAAADYLADGEPWTQQERWEEESGFSPATIAAVVAALVCAADLAEAEGRLEDRNRWLARADEFQSAVEDWTVTTSGPHSDDPYYIRISNDTDPNSGTVDLNNGGPRLPEPACVDPSFLELVRFGVKPADDPVVENSVAVVDDVVRTDTPNGPGWHRYNGDGYGQREDGGPWQGAGVGRIWPFLTGERGEYELRRGTSEGPLAPASLLETMADFANEARMLSEQVWDQSAPTDYGWTFGEGTGAATPLAWAHAQYVRLALSLEAGEPVETPGVVRERYVGPDGGGATFDVADVSVPDGSVGDPLPVTATVENTSDTDGAVRVRVAVDGEQRTYEDRSLSAGESATLTLEVPTEDVAVGDHEVTVTAGGDGEATTVSLSAAGRLVARFEDPPGDDHGPGDYVYPTGSEFEDGDYDLRSVAVYETEARYEWYVTLGTEVDNPWGLPRGFSHQFLQVYFRDPEASGGRTTPRAGVGGELEAPHHYRLAVDGEQTAAVERADGTTVTGDVQTRVDGDTIVVSMPKSALSRPLSAHRLAVLLSPYDGYKEDAGYLRRVAPTASEYDIGGGSEDAPRVMDMLVPGDTTQEAALTYRDAEPTIPYLRVPGGSVETVPGGVGPPQSLDDDDQLEDVDGDGEGTVADVQLLYTRRGSDTVQDNEAAFDFDGDGDVDTADVLALFRWLVTGG